MKAIVAVTNDIVTDRRILKTCSALNECGYKPKIIGRRLFNSLSTKDLPYETYRFVLLFNKKAFFYAEYNIRLFFLLLFSKFDLIVSNDLDTLPACFLAAKIKRKKIIYDSHEYFCYTPELISRPKIQKIWLSIEKYFVPKIKTAITVNSSIAEIYKKQYDVDFKVIRNIPALDKYYLFIRNPKPRKMIGIPENKKMVILQGAGININRGAEELIESFQFIDDAVLFIIGSGDVFEKLKEMRKTLKLEEKVFILDKMPFSQLVHFTSNADIGISIDKATNPNYQYSLPNKIFDYIQIGVPVLASNLVEIDKIYAQFDIGLKIENHEPKHIAEQLNKMIHANGQVKTWKNNLKKAAEEYNWANEREKLVEIIRNAY